jgi:hypothetical protein
MPGKRGEGAPLALNLDSEAPPAGVLEMDQSMSTPPPSNLPKGVYPLQSGEYTPTRSPPEARALGTTSSLLITSS